MDLREESKIPTVDDAMSVVAGARSRLTTIHLPLFPFDFAANRFETTEVARDFVDRWPNRRVFEERRFNHKNSSQFESMIDSRGWRYYTGFLVRTNADIIREFYASVSHNHNKTTAIVRGDPVSFKPTDFNSLFCLPDLSDNEFKNSRLFEDTYTVNMSCNILCPAAPWIMYVIPSYHNAESESHFHHEFGEWKSLLEFRLLPPHLSYTINRHQLTLIYTLLRGDAVNVGLTMYLMIMCTAKEFGVGGLPYRTFITELAKRSGVLEYRNDLIIQSEATYLDETDDGYSCEVYDDMRDFFIYCVVKGIRFGCRNGRE